MNPQDEVELRRVEEIIEELRRVRRRYDTSTRAYAHYSGAVSSLLSVQKILRDTGE